MKSQFLYRGLHIQHIYHHAKFECSRFSSLVNTKRSLKGPPPVLQGTKKSRWNRVKKTTADADINEPRLIFKMVYFNSKAKTIINENEINESIQTSNQEISHGITVWLSKGSGWTVESIDD